MELANLNADTLARLVGVASDIALVVGKNGVVEEVSVCKGALTALDCHTWIGRPWSQTATADSRAKIEAMLQPEQADGDIRWRHVNHPLGQGADIAVQYAVLSLGADGRVLALGRDLEGLAVLQRRLMEAQQIMERDYLRLRRAEAKFLTLLESSGEAVLVVDGISYRVLNANASAMGFFTESGKKLVGRDFFECFDLACREDLQSLMRVAHATGRPEMRRVRSNGAVGECTVSVSVFRQEGGPQFMVRLLAAEAVPPRGATSSQHLMFTEALEQSLDGFVLTDRSGHIQSANSEFLSMLGATALSQVYGHALENWLVRGSVDWGVLLVNLRSQSVVKEFATELRGLAGNAMAVEISALSLRGEDAYYAFYFKDVVRRREQETPATAGMADSVAGLSRLVGRMSMKEIVGETIDMIEKMCVQSALELTNNNRASAAEMLGLSRQSLYVKLRRFDMVGDYEANTVN